MAPMKTAKVGRLAAISQKGRNKCRSKVTDAGERAAPKSNFTAAFRSAAATVSFA